MKWKNIVEKKNAETYVLPAGWDSKEKVAAELECSIDRVNEQLSPAIKSREIEVKAFQVWDKTAKRKIRITAYRHVTAPAQGKK